MRLHLKTVLWAYLLCLINSTIGQMRVASIQIAFGQFRYEIFGEQKTFFEAELACQRNGGTLAKVRTAELQNYMVEQIGRSSLRGNEIYIGLSRQSVRSQYTWRDQTVLEESDYQNWLRGRNRALSRAGIRCVIFGGTGSTRDKWRAETCDTKASYVCEKPSSDRMRCRAGQLSGVSGTSQPAFRRGSKVDFGVDEVIVLFCAGRGNRETMHKVVCSSDGTWKPNNLTNCVRTRCGLPRIPENSYLESVKTSFTDGEEVKYSCISGYITELEQTTTCEVNTGWIRDGGRLPDCEEESISIDETLGDIQEALVRNRSKIFIGAIILVLALIVFCLFRAMRSKANEREHTNYYYPQQTAAAVSVVEPVPLQTVPAISTVSIRPSPIGSRHSLHHSFVPQASHHSFSRHAQPAYYY